MHENNCGGCTQCLLIFQKAKMIEGRSNLVPLSSYESTNWEADALFLHSIAVMSSYMEDMAHLAASNQYSPFFLPMVASSLGRRSWPNLVRRTYGLPTQPSTDFYVTNSSFTAYQHNIYEKTAICVNNLHCSSDEKPAALSMNPTVLISVIQD